MSKNEVIDVLHFKGLSHQHGYFPNALLFNASLNVVTVLHNRSFELTFSI